MIMLFLYFGFMRKEGMMEIDPLACMREGLRCRKLSFEYKCIQEINTLGFVIFPIDDVIMECDN